MHRCDIGISSYIVTTCSTVSGQVLQQVRHNLRSVQDAVELRTIFR